MYTVADTADILFAIPILVYGYLLCLDAYNAFGKNRRLPNWVEPFFLILLGLMIVFISFGDMEGCSHHARDEAVCSNSTASTFLFGSLSLLLGIVSLLSQNSAIFSFNAAWMTPIVLVILGTLFRPPFPSSPPSPHSHDASSSSSPTSPPSDAHGGHANFTGQAFTVCVLSAALSRALLNVDKERWGVLTGYTFSLTAMVHAAKSDYITSSLSFHFTSHTIVLIICVLGAVLMVPLLAYADWMYKKERRDESPLFRPPAKGDDDKGY